MQKVTSGSQRNIIKARKGMTEQEMLSFFLLFHCQRFPPSSLSGAGLSYFLIPPGTSQQVEMLTFPSCLYLFPAKKRAAADPFPSNPKAAVFRGTGHFINTSVRFVACLLISRNQMKARRQVPFSSLLLCVPILCPRACGPRLHHAAPA